MTDSPSYDIAVLITCFNRRETTLRCLRALYEQELPAGAMLRVVLTDDGSSDGTGDAVRTEFPGVVVLQGDGNQYWVGGTMDGVGGRATGEVLPLAERRREAARRRPHGALERPGGFRRPGDHRRGGDLRSRRRQNLQLAACGGRVGTTSASWSRPTSLRCATASTATLC